MRKVKVCMTIEGGCFRAFFLKRKLIKAMKNLCKHMTAEEVQKKLEEVLVQQGYTVTHENGTYIYTKVAP